MKNSCGRCFYITNTGFGQVVGCLPVLIRGQVPFTGHLPAQSWVAEVFACLKFEANVNA